MIFFSGLGKECVAGFLLKTVPFLPNEFIQQASEHQAGACLSWWPGWKDWSPSSKWLLDICRYTQAVVQLHSQNCSWFEQTVLGFCTELNLALHNFLNEPVVCLGCTYLLVLPRAKKKKSSQKCCCGEPNSQRTVPSSPSVLIYFWDQQFAHDAAFGVKNKIFTVLLEVTGLTISISLICYLGIDSQGQRMKMDLCNSFICLLLTWFLTAPSNCSCTAL